jgi:hypothetical protein
MVANPWNVLDEREKQIVRDALDTGEDQEFVSSGAYEKLFNYFAFEAGEMPYGTAKARDGDPVVWICDRMNGIPEP